VVPWPASRRPCAIAPVTSLAWPRATPGSTVRRPGHTGQVG